MRNRISVVAALVATLASGLAVAPAAHADGNGKGFVFIHNVAKVDVVKICVDESDSQGKQIYHKCRGLTAGLKWGHWLSKNADKMWVHLGTAGYGSRNYGPYTANNNLKVCFRPDPRLPERELPSNRCTFG